MSQMYASAVQEGVASLEIMFTVSNATTIAAYNAAYGKEAQRIALRARIGSAQRNLAAIQQDKILTNKQIQINNTQAQAMVKLSAAVAGVTGNSVDSVAYMNDVNKVNALRNSERQAEQQSDQFLSQIQGSFATALGIQDEKISYVGDFMNKAATSFDMEDYQNMGKALKLFGG